jgi:two-component system phosphate regulon sensor histidine kinase PhoR
LKSPLTAIQGFVETLQDGALDEPREARRFLEIIARQVERLMAIVEDLLHLSRIEQEEERGEIELETLPLKPVLQAAIQDCEAKAADGSVRVELACEEALSADINAALLEQAVVNLLDNAIKYSADGREVRLSAMEQNGQLRISVQDHGKGIPARHLPRLFERFYRVDTARSRELGGTGLGLAIVKHIAQAHGGSVTVESRTGRGSTFAICLPR